MGSATRHRQAFLAAHRLCAFCGGQRLAVTIEHCPPRAMFQNRLWPEGFEFPACEVCNSGTSDHDLLISFLARFDPISGKGDLDGKGRGILERVRAQFPDIFASMLPTTREARIKNRDLGIVPTEGRTHQQMGVLKLTPKLHQALFVFSSKLAKAIYYNETKQIFPENGCLGVQCLSNAELILKGRYEAFDDLDEFFGKAPILTRSSLSLNDQFEYKFSITESKELFTMQARFGNGFALVVFGSPVKGCLEADIVRLRQETGWDGPFKVLQSSILPSVIELQP